MRRDVLQALQMHDKAESSYIEFEDAEVVRVLNEHGVGSNGKITQKDIDKVTTIGRWFENNTIITSFKELVLFKNVERLEHPVNGNYGAFKGCTNLKKIDFFNIKEFGPGSITDSGIEEIYAPNCNGCRGSSATKKLLGTNTERIDRATNCEFAVIDKPHLLVAFATVGTYIFNLDVVNDVPYPQYAPSKTSKYYVKDIDIDGVPLIDLYKQDTYWSKFPNIYVIGGDEWIAQFGARDARAYLIGTIAEEFGHVKVTGTGVDRVVTDTGV